ncbi:phytanoyl-CoA dioxygenase family protein [Paenibacillus cellulosilyticus]|nr:phytanoyl-CoA dioxygenase family protein [Paenibacillus cellulosilyticus]
MEDEILEVRAELLKIIEKEMRIRSTRNDVYGKAFLQIMNVWRCSDLVKRFVFTKRFAYLAARLLGTEEVRLYYDCVLFKQSGGGHTPIHIDPFVVDASKVITMWMPLTDIPNEVGSLHFMTGSHLMGTINRSIERLVSDAYRKQLPLVTYGAMKAGDVTFHSGWTIHGAPPNPTDGTREVLAITYFKSPEKIIEFSSNSHRQESLSRYFVNLTWGNDAITEFNPILYSGHHL